MRSTWLRLIGDGEPDDFSAGSSVDGDYTDPPSLHVVPEAAEAAMEPSEPIEPPQAVPDGLADSWHPTPTPVVRPPVDPATGWRLFVKFLRSQKENR